MAAEVGAIRERVPDWNATTVGILLFAVVLRGYRLGHDSLWLDEVYTVVVWPQKSLGGLFFGAEPHPPLYFALSNLWLSVVGTSTVTARVLPAVFGVGLVGAVIYAGRVYGDRWTGATAGLLVTVSPTFIHFSQTARMYSLWALLSVLSMTAFTVLVYRDRTPLLLYLVGTVGMVYTHAFGVFLLGLQNVYYLAASLRGDDPGRLGRGPWVRLQMIVGLLSLPVLLKYGGIFLQTVSGSGRSSIDWLTTPTVDAFVRTLVSFGGQPIYYPNVTTGSVSYTASLLVLALVCGLAVYGVYRRLRAAESERVPGRGRGWLVLVAWLVGVAVVPFVASRAVPVYTPRNVHIAAVPLFLLAGLGVAAVRETPFETPVSPLRVALVLTVAGGLLVSTGVYYDTPSAEDWRGAAAHVEASGDGESPVVTVPPWADRPFDFYYGGSANRTVSWQAGENVSSLPDSDRIWVVSRYPQQGASLRASLNESMRMASDRRFRNVRVTLFVTPENRSTAPSTATGTPRAS